MAEELLEFEDTIADEHDGTWIAVVMGRQRDDGLWVGWVRFDASDGSSSRATDRETTQPNRADLDYWATGLTYAYLEGALKRAQQAGRPARGG